MEIDVNIKIEPRSDFIKRTIESGTKLETIANEFQKDLPYTILAAKVNNKLEELTKKIEKPSKIELIDMRNQNGNLIYQRSISLIYLKAVHDVLGNSFVRIENSLSKGLYTDIKCKENITYETLKLIEERMRQIVELDLPIIRQVMPKEDAMKYLMEEGYKQKAKMLEKNKDVKKVKFYSLDGFRNFFYGLMVPSTKYIQYFELVKYRRGIILRFPHPSTPNVIPKFVDESKLYQAFGEATNWGKLMGISFVGDLNEKIESGEYKEIIQISEALHEKKIAQIADMIKAQKKRIILIAGPSSSGKTTFARRLCIQLRVNGLEPLYMGTDDYFVERENTPLDENGEPNFEDLEALDIDLFNSNMNSLLNGDTVDLPTFDFLKGIKIFGKRIIKIKKNQPIVIEGIHGLNKQLTEQIDDKEKFKIYISPLTQLNIDNHNRIPTTEARMIRRMVRDSQFRGRNAQTTIKEWPKVRAGEDKNIFPFNGEADVFFNSEHIYELAVLKKYAEPLLENIKKEEPEYGEAISMLKFLKFFNTIEDDSIIVNNSIIREFIGGSIFV
ncbi:nucleoside kinase [Anaerovorax odorimutans]|uniref:nucleoside kinase n=1 Tax=Anaerovorax odorimutans TaxID=109327 RepID=UPI0004006963|nr:nucleoside kinase [Anaerovorax odorimutans]